MFSDMKHLTDRSNGIADFTETRLKEKDAGQKIENERQDALYWKYYDFKKLLYFPI